MTTTPDGPAEVDAAVDRIRLWRGVRRRLVYALIATVVVGAIAYLVSARQPERYEATTVIAVSGSGYGEALLAGVPRGSGTSMTLENRVASGLIELKLPNLREAARRRLDTSYSKAEVDRAVTVSAQADTGLINVTATSTDPQRAKRVSLAVSEAFVDKKRRADRAEIGAAVAQARRQYRELSRDDQRSGVGTALQSRLQSLEAAAGVAYADVRIVQGATLPVDAVTPVPARDALLAGFLCLLASLGLIALRAATDDRLHDVRAAAEIWGTPAIGLIPGSKTLLPGADQRVGDPAQESVAIAAANLRNAGMGTRIRSVLVTSAVAGEGKTTVAWGLALSFAAAGRRVLLVEADLRQPSLGRWAGVNDGTGLAELLAGSIERVDAIQRLAEFDLVPAGTAPAAIAQLMQPERLRTRLEPMFEEYEVVLIDTPPAVAVADALAFAGLVDGVVVVSRLNRSTATASHRLGVHLDDAGFQVLGHVVNGVKVDSAYRYGSRVVPRVSATSSNA